MITRNKLVVITIRERNTFYANGLFNAKTLRSFGREFPSNPKVDGMTQHSFTILMKNLTDFTDLTKEFIFFLMGYSVIGYLKIM